VIAPALITLTAALIWAGEFDEAERWLQRARRARQADSGPDSGLLLHHCTGMLLACRGWHHEALAEFAAADLLQSQLHHTGHAALRAEILDVLRGSSPAARHPDLAPPAEHLGGFFSQKPKGENCGVPKNVSSAPISASACASWDGVLTPDALNRPAS
jgi:hypothetical protein